MFRTSFEMQHCSFLQINKIFRMRWVLPNWRTNLASTIFVLDRLVELELQGGKCCTFEILSCLIRCMRLMPALLAENSDRAANVGSARYLESAALEQLKWKSFVWRTIRYKSLFGMMTKPKGHSIDDTRVCKWSTSRLTDTPTSASYG